jgi:hypothetical protein
MERNIQGANPRELLAEIIAEFPDGPEEKWRAEFHNRVRSQRSGEYLEAIVTCWLEASDMTQN